MLNVVIGFYWPGRMVGVTIAETIKPFHIQDY